jgi:menaquinone-dependent protoporphyrinogen oxidase
MHNLLRNKVLVTYASRGGSTVEVAAAIAQTLINGGLSAEMMPMQTVKNLTAYDAVVAGSAVQREAWLPEAMQFMRQHQTELQKKPFAAFLTCLALSAQKDKAKQTVESWLQPVRTMVNPVSEGYFAGVLNLRNVPLLYRILFRTMLPFSPFSEGDFRDWDAIHGWAKQLSIAFLHGQETYGMP